MTVAPGLDAEPRRIIHGACRFWLAGLEQGHRLAGMKSALYFPVAVDCRWAGGRVSGRARATRPYAWYGRRAATSQLCGRSRPEFGLGRQYLYQTTGTG